LLFVAAVGSGAEAAPRLQTEVSAWLNTKTKDVRRMFLAEPGDEITFSIRCNEAVSCEWQVNKKRAGG
jgi:hypothetical protein